MKKAIVALSILYTSLACGLQPTIVTSLPKSGTHLLHKAVELLSGASPKWTEYTTIYELVHKKWDTSPNHFLCTHIPYHLSCEQALRKNNIKCIFLYRDPRDQATSYAHQVLKALSIGGSAVWSIARDRSFDDILESVIANNEFYAGWPGLYGTENMYKVFIPWLNCPDICLPITFEELIGPNGGGSTAQQEKALNKINSFLSLNCNSKTIQWISAELWGGTATFRAGKIGAWKECFTERHKELFKKTAGNLLIFLGYESDYNW